MVCSCQFFDQGLPSDDTYHFKRHKKIALIRYKMLLVIMQFVIYRHKTCPKFGSPLVTNLENQQEHELSEYRTSP